MTRRRTTRSNRPTTRLLGARILRALATLAPSPPSRSGRSKTKGHAGKTALPARPAHHATARRRPGARKKRDFSLPPWFSFATLLDQARLIKKRPTEKRPALPVRTPLLRPAQERSEPVQTAESLDKRLLVMAGMFLLAFLILAFRAFHLTIVQQPHLQQIVHLQHRKKVIMPAHRGRILDRNGRTLAISLPVKTLSVDIDRMNQPDRLAKQRAPDQPAKRLAPDRLAKQLAPLIGLPYQALRRRLEKARPGSFPILKRRLPPTVIHRIKQLENPALFMIPETQRFYPMGEITSHLLGFTNFEGQGVEGLERTFEETIQGTPGLSLFAQDRLGRPLPTAQVITEAKPGSDMILTLDTNIQYIAYRTLLKGVSTAKAKGGMVVVMNPNNGEIYAMVNQPGFNPNNLGNSKAHTRRNRAIADAYEPGSTFKVVTVSAALDLGVVTPDTLFDIEGGKFRVANRIIRDFHRGKKWLSVSQIVETSSNVGAAKIGLKMGNASMDNYIYRFGFGRPTEIGLFNESSGSIPDITASRHVGLASRSYGYGITATPLQITMATAAVVNGGLLYMPRIVMGKRVEDQHTPEPPPEPERILQAETSEKMRAILAMAVGPHGTAPKANVAGYRVAGKTGTARKAVGREGYVKGLYFSSFVGFVPAHKPEILIYVGIDEPQGDFYGGLVAAPIFRDIAQEILPLLSILPEQHTDPELPALGDPVHPDLIIQPTDTGTNLASTPGAEGAPHQQVDTTRLLQHSLIDALTELQQEQIIPRIHGHGRVVRVQRQEDGTLHLYLE